MSAWCPGTDTSMLHQKKGEDLQVHGQSLQFSCSPCSYRQSLGKEEWPGLLPFA